jgi:hypothetical protein
MHSKIILLLVFANLVFIHCLYGQKKFSVTLTLPLQLNIKKLILTYDNGKEEVWIRKPVINNNNEISISDSFYSKYATIILRYPKKTNIKYQSTFFFNRYLGKNCIF